MPQDTPPRTPEADRLREAATAMRTDWDLDATLSGRIGTTMTAVADWLDATAYEADHHHAVGHGNHAGEITDGHPTAVADAYLGSAT